MVASQNTRHATRAGTLLLVAFLGVIALVAIVEAILHAYAALAGAPPFARTDGTDLLLQREPLLEYRLRPGFHRGHVHINSRGFRGAEFTASPAPGTTRIVALGDSCTFGTYTYLERDGRPAVSVTDAIATSYPAMLHQLLDRSGAGRYEVINAGVPGYASRQIALWLEGEILAYRPSVVVVYVGWNDLNNAFSPGWRPEWATYGGWRRALVESGAGRVAHQVLRRSAMIETAYGARMARLGTSGSAHGARLSAATVREHGTHAIDLLGTNLGLLVQRAKARGTSVVLVTLPSVVTPALDAATLRAHDRVGRWDDRAAMETLLAALNRTVRVVGRERGVPVVDLAAIFASRDTRALFSDDSHPNAAGSALVAEEIGTVVRGLRAGGSSGS